MKHPTEIDAYIGRRVKARRRAIRMSQWELADAMGVSFQQLQKNERGENKLPASRLWVIAKTLQRPVSWFYPESDTTEQRKQLLQTLQLEEIRAVLLDNRDETIEDEMAEIADLLSDAIAKREQAAEEGPAAAYDWDNHYAERRGA